MTASIDALSLFTNIEDRVAFDLGAYFEGRESDGPWLRWGRGTRSAWLPVRYVADVFLLMDPAQLTS